MKVIEHIQNIVSFPTSDPESIKHWLNKHIEKIEWGINGNQYEGRGCCPLHEDKNPSASFNAEKRCWICYAGCTGGKLSDLAQRIGWEDPFHRASETTYQKHKETIYPYRDENRNLLFEVVRIDSPKGKRIWQRRPDGNGGYVKGLGKETKLIPYRLPDLLAVINRGKKAVCITEGEKCVDLLWNLKIPATCNPLGSGKFKEEYAKLIPVNTDIFILPDADTPGQKHVKQVSEIFMKRGHRVKVLDFGYPVTDKGGKDVYDWILQDGHNREELIELIQKTPFENTRIGHQVFSSLLDAARIVNTDYPEPNWVIPGVIPEGCTLLAGKPKFGKSWFALQICVAIANGGYIFNRKVKQAEVLYLALEDVERRLKERLTELGGGECLEKLKIQTEWERGAEGLRKLDALLEYRPEIKLVIIDTLQWFRNLKTNMGNLYSDDSEDIAGIKKIANKHGIGILVIHHVRKCRSDDPFDSVSGSLGLNGTADTIIVIEKDPAVKHTTLHVKGRDVEEQQLAISRDEHAGWVLLGNASEIPASGNEQKIIDFLKENGPSRVPIVATGTGITYDNIRQYLSKMTRKGILESRGRGVYSCPIVNNVNLVNECENRDSQIFSPSTLKKSAFVNNVNDFDEFPF